VKVLEALLAVNNDNIVPLLASFMYGSKRCFLFPLAEKSLCDLMLHSDPPLLTAANVIGWVMQCHGLAKAVAAIHGVRDIRISALTIPSLANKGSLGVPANAAPMIVLGYHHDITPSNLLIYRNPSRSDEIGTIKLGDFGLAQIQECLVMGNGKVLSRQTRTQGNITYMPPDKELTSACSRPADIWSLARTLLDHYIWMLTGCSARRKFSSALNNVGQGVHVNCAWEITNGRAKLKPVLEEIHESLKNHKACHGGLRMLLDLLFEILRSLDKFKRMDAQTMTERLQSCVQETERNIAENPNFFNYPQDPELLSEAAKQFTTDDIISSQSQHQDLAKPDS
jgi:serine/threonine protein kinase